MLFYPLQHLFSFAGMIRRMHRRSLSDKTYEQLLVRAQEEIAVTQPQLCDFAEIGQAGVL